MHKTIGYKKKYTRYDEKNKIRRKSKKYLGLYHRLFYISLNSRKILYTNLFEKILAKINIPWNFDSFCKEGYICIIILIVT